MAQLNLFDQKPKRKRKFHGADFVESRDQSRLERQIDRIFNVMKDGVWRSVDEIAELTKDETTGFAYKATSISAQLRNLKKPENGSHTLNRRHEGNGFYRFQIIPSEANQ